MAGRQDASHGCPWKEPERTEASACFPYPSLSLRKTFPTGGAAGGEEPGGSGSGLVGQDFYVLCHLPASATYNARLPGDLLVDQVKGMDRVKPVTGGKTFAANT